MSGLGDGAMPVKSEGKSYIAVGHSEASAMCKRESGMSTAVAMMIYVAETG